MTKTKQATKSAKPAPVELRDEALDAAVGGLAAVKKATGTIVEGFPCCS